MANVVFVAPYFLEATMKFIEATANLPHVRLAIISHDPERKLPEGVRRRMSAHWRVENCLDPAQIVSAIQEITPRFGSVDRLIASLEELQVPLAEAREALGIPGMKAEAARNFRDKVRMKTVLGKAGLPCARHRLVSDSADALAFATEIGYPLVVKPPAGAGARNTFRVENAEQMSQWLASMPPTREQPALIEEFLSGQEHSFDSVFLKGKPVWHSISRYFPTPLEVLQNPWIQWCVLLPREIDGHEYNDIRDVAARSLKTLGLETGLTHMEWFRRGNGSVAVSEVAARPPGAQFTTLISYAHDFNLYRSWAQLLVHERFDPPPRKWAVGAAYLRGQGKGRVAAVHGLDQAYREVGPLVIEAKLPSAGQSASSTYEGEGYVILRHPDTDVVARGLSRLVSLIRVELGA